MSERPHVRVEWDGWAYVISDEDGRFAGVATDHPAASMEDVLRYVSDLIHGPGTLGSGSLRERTTVWEALNGSASGKEECLNPRCRDGEVTYLLDEDAGSYKLPCPDCSPVPVPSTNRRTP